MTTTTLTPQQKLTLVKHLAGGKPVDVVATIMHTTKDAVLDVARNHGYPDTSKLQWAADVMAKNIEQGDALPERPIVTGEQLRPRGESVTSPPAPAPAQPLTRPDEIRVLLNTAKAHPSKRIQQAADRVFDGLDRLRKLIADDEEKHAERRRLEAAKAAQKAEVARLERELAEAKARLRDKTGAAQRPGGEAAKASGQLDEARVKAHGALLSNEDLEPHGLTSKELRTWAHEHDVDCPDAGRLPRRVLDVWIARHEEAAAS